MTLAEADFILKDGTFSMETINLIVAAMHRLGVKSEDIKFMVAVNDGKQVLSAIGPQTFKYVPIYERPNRYDPQNKEI